MISTGLMTERALDAADELASRGIEVSVLHMPTIKPFDAARSWSTSPHGSSAS